MRVRDALGVLGLAEYPEPRRLRDAYLTAVKAAHPDKPGGDAARLRLVIEAYESLRDRRAPEPESARQAGPAFSQGAPSNVNSMSPASPIPRQTNRRLDITPIEAVLGGVKSVPMRGAGEVAVRLTPGLRVGDLVSVAGILMTVAISSEEKVAIVSDHVCLRVQVEQAFLSGGGKLQVSTPTGPLNLHISRQDAARGLVRIDGGGLPPQGPHGQGHLFIKLEPGPVAEAGETRTRTLLRRFTANWAA